jgi:lipoate-protein ligase A
MRFLSLHSTDPTFNLAVEESLVSQGGSEDVVMLWQNFRTVVIGRNQDAAEQINRDYLEREGITLVRRLSGGGAVYHDEGNLNFSVIKRRVGTIAPDFSFFTQPVIAAIARLGGTAVFSGRNDIELAGHKISGNAQYRWHDTVMHHGTILFSSDLSMLAQVLKPKERKSEGFKGVKSHVSRVANLSDYLTGTSFEEFRTTLVDCLLADASGAVDLRALSAEEIAAAEILADERYRQDSWNWRALPRVGDAAFKEELD